MNHRSSQFSSDCVQQLSSPRLPQGSHWRHETPPPNRMFLFLLFPCFCVLRVVPRCAVSHFNLSQAPRPHIAFSLRYDCWTSALTSQWRSEASCYLLAPSHRHALSFCPSNTHTHIYSISAWAKAFVFPKKKKRHLNPDLQQKHLESVARKEGGRTQRRER